MKLRIVSEYQVLSLIVVSAGNQCQSIDPKPEGEACSSHKDCMYPLVCYHTTCSQRKSDNDTCSSNADCASDVTKMRCLDGKCALEASNGESCIERNCVDTSACTNDVCVAKDCSSDDECGLGYYCSDSKCNKAKSGGSCSKDSMCPVDEVCSSDVCVAKYSGDIGSPCHHPEQCNIFDGITCDKNAFICKRNQYIDKECYVDSECGGGSCICGGSKKTCFGFGGAVSNPSCKDAAQVVSKCLIDNQCSRIHPITCSTCYQAWLCYQYRCNGNSANDPTLSEMDEKCPKISSTKPTRGGTSQPKTTGSNNNNPVEEEGNSGNNANTLKTSIAVVLLSFVLFLTL